MPFCSSNRYLQSASLLDESYADIRNLLPCLLITWCHNCYIFSYIIYGIHTTILSNLNSNMISSFFDIFRHFLQMVFDIYFCRKHTSIICILFLKTPYLCGFSKKRSHQYHDSTCRFLKKNHSTNFGMSFVVSSPIHNLFIFCTYFLHIYPLLLFCRRKSLRLFINSFFFYTPLYIYCSTFTK